MYRPAAFVVDDVAEMHRIIRTRAFATVAAMLDGAIHFAYAPVMLDANEGPFGTVRFHLARGNPVAAAMNGASMALSFVAADAYVSPDWYETAGMVPTWNYITVEGRGAAARIEGERLRQLLVDLSAVEEQKLAPKAPWTVDKVPEAKMAVLLNAIVGFSVRLETLEGKFKLSQNVKPEDAAGVVHGLETRGDAPSTAVAKAMRGAR